MLINIESKDARQRSPFFMDGCGGSEERGVAIVLLEPVLVATRIGVGVENEDEVEVAMGIDVEDGGLGIIER